jgi:hypothetical protein
MSAGEPKFTPEVVAEHMRRALARFIKDRLRDHLYLFPDICQVVYETVGTCHWLTTEVSAAGVEIIRQTWFPDLPG